MKSNEDYLRMAVALARENVGRRGGRPFGAVLVRNGEIIATGVNEILATHDPSTHAEMQAIRAATTAQKSPRLDGCIMYASGNPCPMCLALMHMIGFTEVYYSYSNDNGEAYGLSTAKIYAQMATPLSQQSMKIEHVPLHDGEHLYAAWHRATK